MDNFKTVKNLLSTSTKNSSSPINRLRKKFNLTKNESISKSLQWQDDEKAVRIGIRSFHVKYLGYIEVEKCQGINICEKAIQVLLNIKDKHMKGILHISSDALRVVDKQNKILILDQTIEKVSFCSPDHHHKKGFAYICRDGTTRRWLCHGFFAINETGERLSHTVGCAFQICLERKQKRDQQCNVTVEYTPNKTSFTKFGSFRTTSIVERMVDPQCAFIAETIPCTPINPRNKFIERPRPKGNNSDSFLGSPSIHMTNLSSIKELEIISTTNKLSLFNSTNTNQTSLLINSNLTTLFPNNQSNNLYLPYNYSIVDQSQNLQSIIFTSKYGRNPFDDDLIC